MTDLTAAAKFDILREVFELAREQRAALEGDHFDRFEELLDLRAGLLRRLGLIEAGGEPLPENVVAFPVASRMTAEDRLALDTLIKGILEHDRNNEALLAERMREIREELPVLENVRRANIRYRAAPEPAAYVDLVS